MVAAGILVAAGLFPTAAPGAAATETDQPETETLADVLVAASQAGAATAEDFARETALAERGPGSLFLDEEGRVSATVFLDGADEGALDRLREAIGEGGALEAPPTIMSAATVWVEASRLEELRAVPGVTGVTPNLRPMSGAVSLEDRLAAVRSGLTGALDARADRSGGAAKQAPGLEGSEGSESRSAECRAFPVEADAPLRSGPARSEFETDGTGVTIGIISDSFASLTSPSSWEEDVAAGLLPGPGNPCGRTEPVTIVSDANGGADEGRAMAQLVHGIAPGAKLLFVDSGVSDITMASNIALLVEAGADIIVDDVSYFQEPYFQKGAISTVYERAQAEHGVLAISAAGNSTATATQGEHAGAPHSSWQTAAYRPMACPDWVPINERDPLYGRDDIDCLDFDPGPGAQAYDVLTMTGESSGDIIVMASIGEPMHGVTTEYELRFYQEDERGAPQPIERVLMIGGPYAGAIGGLEVNPGAKVRMVFVRTGFDAEASPEPAVFIGFPRGAGAIVERQFMGGATSLAEGDRVGSMTLGHNGDGSALSIAAVAWDDPTRIRPFSSLGPTTLLFDRVAVDEDLPRPAARLAEPLTVSAPHAASVDGTRTSFFGGDAEAPEYRFTGTSAAAPHAAGVAALALSYAPDTSAEELRTALVRTARAPAASGLVNPYDPALFPDSEVFGAGLIDAHALLASLPAPTEPEQPDGPDAASDAGGTGDPGGAGDAGAGGAGDAGASGSGDPGGTRDPSGDGLTATGGEATPFAVAGAAALLLGAGLVLAARARRRRTRG